MRKKLFREQAVRFQQQRLNGDVLVTPIISHAVVCILLLAWLTATLIFLFTQEYSRKATVQGWLEPPEGVVRHFATSPGVITHIHVNEGQRVVAGQPLVTMSGNTTIRQGEYAEQQMLESFTRQLKGLTLQKEQTVKLHTLSMQKQQETIISLNDDAGRARKVAEVANARLSINLKQAESARQLFSAGHISEKDLNSVNASLFAQQQEVMQLERDIAQLSAQIKRARQSILQLPEEHKIALLALEHQEQDLRVQMTQIEKQSGYVVVAAKDGIISQLPATVGQHITASHSIATIIPASGTVRARMYVPVRDAGFLQGGQLIAVRYDAFPFQKFGIHKGTINHISQSLLLPGELSQSPVQLPEPAYLVTAELASQSLAAYGNTIPLKAGMTFSADIELSRRSLIEWLFEPLLSLTGRV